MFYRYYCTPYSRYCRMHFPYWEMYKQYYYPGIYDSQLQFANQNLVNTGFMADTNQIISQTNLGRLGLPE